MQGKIYLIRNKINEKSYVGQTAKSLESRLKAHERGSSKNSIIYKAIKKYGIDNFEVSILVDNIQTREELNDYEIMYINELNTLLPNGYNMTAGGYGSNRKPIFTTDQIDTIAELYENGMSSTALAKQYNVNHHTITKYLRNNGVKIREGMILTQREAIPEHLYNVIVAMFLSGTKMQDISIAVNYSIASIDRLLTKLNIQRRTGRKAALKITKEEFVALLDEYKQERKVATVLGVTVSAITYYKHKFDIPIRNTS